MSTAGVDRRTARGRLDDGEYDLVLCDIMMPDGNGLDLLREIQQGEGNTAVIMMTAYSSTKSAIEAMKAGAYDYISKPFDVEEIKVLAERALEKTALEEQNVYLRRELEGKYTFSNNIIGASRNDARDLLAGRAGGADQLDGADPRRERHRQGADRPGDPLREPALGGQVPVDQLRRAAREPARERALRPREGGLHRRRAREEGPVPGGRPAAPCSSTRSAR